jgi:hypothetical protein
MRQQLSGNGRLKRQEAIGHQHCWLVASPPIHRWVVDDAETQKFGMVLQAHSFAWTFFLVGDPKKNSCNASAQVL